MNEPCETSEPLYDRLMRLKPAELTTRAWTINAGVSSAFFDNLAAGGSPREGELPKILAVVGTTLASFEGRARPVSASSSTTGPVLRMMPRPPKQPVGGSEMPDDAAPSCADPGAQGGDSADGTAGNNSPYAEATAEAIARWLEAKRQAAAAGLDTDGSEGGRLVSDIARLALDLSPVR